MKKKIFLVLSMIFVLACVFAFTVSAESRIIKLDYDPGLDCDDSLVSYLEDDYAPYTPSTWASVTGGLDKDSRVVLTDGNGGYYVFPSWYVYRDEAFETNRPGNHNSYKHCIKFERLNAAIAKYNEDNSTSYFAAFSDHKAALVRLEILRGVANISQNTQKFEDCKLLKEVRFPSTLSGIDAQNCFTGSTIEKIDLSMTTITYLSNAFASSTANLGEVILPSTCKTINQYAFQNSSLTSINTDNVTSYGQHVFSGTTNLKTFVIKEGVTTIPVNFMQNATGLESIVFPSTLTTFNGYSFQSCTNLETIEFKQGSLTSISDCAFYNCTSLKNVILTDSIQTLGQKVFYYCSALEYIKLPANLRIGGHDLFSGCNKLATIVVPKTMTQLCANNAQCKYAFHGKGKIIYTGTADDAFYKNELLNNYSASNITFQNHCEVYYNNTHKLDGELTKYFTGEKYLSTYIEECACGNGCGVIVPKNEVAPLFKLLGYSKCIIPGRYDISNNIAINHDAIDTYNQLVSADEKISSYGVIAAGYMKAEGEYNVVDGDLINAEKKAVVDYTGKSFDIISMKVSGFTASDVDRQLYCTSYIVVGSTYYYASSICFEQSATEIVSYNSIAD